ncbi:hypothetical protein K470DRAFT_270870 [Piedraia hortae CBS 480.64]|uniref:Uncharacterized protein n=1 Tax=Piedraia hortae CBS 480.64 TaxID=1314780 RepID=A0A6A7BYR0_9PEZI|nr:hypothetical protein K470DRAFT_270870 [Piedraia hortae CBS 480.64]
MNDEAESQVSDVLSSPAKMSLLWTQHEAELQRTMDLLGQTKQLIQEIETEMTQTPTTAVVRQGLPLYTLGTTRQRVAEVAAVMTQLDPLFSKTHRQISNFQADNDVTSNGASQAFSHWQERVEKMTSREREHELRELRLQDDAESKRLKQDLELVSRSIRARARESSGRPR